MKKKFITLFLVCVLGFSLLAGCGPVDREAQESYRQLGIAQLQEGKYSDAVTNFQKALDQSFGKIGARELDICYYKALAQFKAGQIYAAIETYNALIEYDDENADAYFLRGSAYLQASAGESDESKSEELFDKGILDYNQAVSLDGNNYKLYIGIYENLKGVGRETYAEEFLAKALNLSCETGQDYCDQGYIYLMLENFDKADELLATAVEKGCDQAMLYQAQLRKEQGNEEEARTLLQAYSEKYPEDVDALHQAGILAINAGEYSEAVKMLEQAYSYAGKGAEQELMLNLVYAYEYAGQFNAAYELMKEYVKLYPADAEAAREYEFLKTRTGTSKTPAERAEAEADTPEEGSDNSGDSSDNVSEGSAGEGEGGSDIQGQISTNSSGNDAE